MSDELGAYAARPSIAKAGEVFAVFLKLGLTSFGGPIAHIGYFRNELVTRRNWLDDNTFTDFVALCQFLPGPTSSQVGFTVGLMRAGWLGALAAFAGFTFPSAVIMVIVALNAKSISGLFEGGVVHGLKIVAVAVVAQALLGMARTLCPDRIRASIAIAAILILVALPSSVGMVAAIASGAIFGLMVLRDGNRNTSDATESGIPTHVNFAQSICALIAFVSLFAVLPLVAQKFQSLSVIASFYRAGAMVFGGGHVVLPLLQTEVVQTGWVSQDQFLAGYGAAQAIPGPLFSFAAYLGAVIEPASSSLVTVVSALLAIFLPGFLILVAVLPFWRKFQSARSAQALMKGANAAVVGILGAALYSPIFVSAVANLKDFALAAAFFVLLVAWKMPPWIVVVLAAVAGACLA